MNQAAARGRARCYLVYALAPGGTSARAANDALNEYVADLRRGVPVCHDHFAEAPHGGFAVFHVSNDDQLAMLDDPGPLDGWELRRHALTYALTPVGFASLIDFSLEVYGKTTLERLRAEEQPDKRFWWQREG